MSIILKYEGEIGRYSKPILGLYLSIAVICCKEISDVRAETLSARAYGINPIFGKTVSFEGKNRSMQTQRIIDFSSSIPKFDWGITGKTFDENLKILGEIFGFTSNRPEQKEKGTLDVCWCDEERKIVIGFENKVDKTNKILSKTEIDQCSGHMNWLTDNFIGYEKVLFIVGDIEGYHDLASPHKDLSHIDISDIARISDKISLAYAKKTFPEQIDQLLLENNLIINKLFPTKKVIDSKKVKFN
ncbi:MAG: hypothetical protein PHS04_17585 [Tissierellia bacterium]|nr:hypothetical protein [Tissierellia bacterium]MDD4439824.1 hypothetical protein [Tissierellia bacterium]